MPLRRFNQLSRDGGDELLRSCLNVDRWVRTLPDHRPYANLDDLFEMARDAAFPLTGAELEAALAGRKTPPLLKPAGRGDTPIEARAREQLAAEVQDYEERFGRPFLITTTGRPPSQLLAQLRMRLGNDLDTEDQVLAQQLRQLALLELAIKLEQ